MKRLLCLLLAVAALAVSAAHVAPAAPAAAAAKTCRAGYVHAVLPWGEKCLHAGEFCRHSLDRVYRRYGFRCVRYDPRVERYRLTRSR